MANSKHKDLWTAVTAPFTGRFGPGRDSDRAGYDLSKTSGYIQRYRNAADTQDMDVLGTDAYDKLIVGGFCIRPLRLPIVFTLATNASLTTQRFFTADQPLEIRSILYSHATADGAVNTGYISKETPGQAPGAGVSVQTGTFDLNATANTVAAATLANRNQPGFFGAGEPTISLNTNEMLSFKIASAVTSLAGVQITIYALPQNSFAPAVYVMKANGDIATSCFFLANRPVKVTGVSMVWDTAATNGSAVTMDVTKDTSTNAPGAGTTILAAAQSVKGTINTPVNPALAASAATLTLAAGDRLAVKTSGTLTALAGLVIVVSFANAQHAVAGPSPIAGMIQPVFNLFKNANLGVDESFFTADRDYEFHDVSAVWSVVEGASGRVTVTVDIGTTAPGAGTSALTDNTNAGFDTTATANTVVVGTLAVSKRTIFVPAGARLSIKGAGTKGSFAGLVIAVSLLPR